MTLATSDCKSSSVGLLASQAPRGEAYLSRYTHRVAISNSRLLKTDGDLPRQELSCRRRGAIYHDDARRRRVHPPLPSHVLPKRQHRIRHYGLFANGSRVENIALARKLIGVTAAEIANAAAPPMRCARFI